MRTARTPSAMGFTGHDRSRLARALRRARELRLFRRVQAVLGVARGHPVREVARLVGASARSAYDWVGRYLRRHRVEDLGDEPRPGRPRAAPRVSDARIRREFAKDPMRLGYRSTGWTVPLLAGHLGRRYGPIGARTLRRRMRVMGLRWKRPRHRYGGRAPWLGQKKGASCGG